MPQMPKLHIGAPGVVLRAMILAGCAGAVVTRGAEPTNLNAIAGNGIVSIVWRRPDTLKTETYRIYRSTTAGNTGATPFRTISNIPAIPTNMTGRRSQDGLGFLMAYGDTSVVNGTTYYYQVSMVRGGVESARTASVSATPVSASRAITKGRFLKIMPMGNSITAGWCGDCGSCSKVLGGYRGSLYDTLRNGGYNFSFVGSCIDLSEGKPWQYHEGWGSRTVQDILRMVVVRALTAWAPDLVLLQIGTNNFAWGGSDVQGALRAYDSLLMVITSAKPEPALLVAPILPLPGNSRVDPFNAGVKKKVDSLANLGRRITWASEMEAIDVSRISPDKVHPYCSAYPVIASAWYRAIRRMTDATSPVSDRAARGPAPRSPIADSRDPASDGPATLYSVRGRLVSDVRSRPGMYVGVVAGKGPSVLRRILVMK